MSFERAPPHFFARSRGLEVRLVASRSRSTRVARERGNASRAVAVARASRDVPRARRAEISDATSRGGRRAGKRGENARARERERERAREDGRDREMTSGSRDVDVVARAGWRDARVRRANACREG